MLQIRRRGGTASWRSHDEHPIPVHRYCYPLGWVLALTSTAYFMVMLDTGALFTALPRMQRDLHADLASLQWTVNSYGIAFAAGIITAAALGDRFGRRRVFNLGLALFTLASAACALAPDTAVLVVARTVQGIGAAAVLPLSLTILTTAFPPQRRGMIVGIYGGLAGLAVASGPIVGGVVTEELGWHWIFWLNVPIGLVATALATRLLPESHGAPERLDLVGVALVTAGVVALVWALVRANDAGWSSAEIISTLVAGCALLLALFRWEQHVRRADAAAADVPQPGLRRRQPHDVPDVRSYLRRRVPDHPGVPVRPGILAGLDRAAAAALLRDADARLADRRRALRPDRTAPDHGDRPRAAGARLRLGRRHAGRCTPAGSNSWSPCWWPASASRWRCPPCPPPSSARSAGTEMGKASGINYMAQRFGAVFAIAIASAVFSAHGNLSDPAAVTAGFRPALWSCVIFATLAALTSVAISARPPRASNPTPAADVYVAA